MKKLNIFRLLSTVTIAAAGALGLANAKSAKNIENVEAAPSSVKIAGSFTSWASQAITLSLDQWNQYYTYTRSFSVNDEFKIIVNGSDWVGYGNGVTNSVGTSAISGSGGSNFKVLIADTYVIKIVNNIDTYGDKSYGITLKKAPSSTNNQFYVYDPHNILGSTLSNVKVYGFGQAASINNMEWNGTNVGISKTTLGRVSVYSVSLSSSYPQFIINNGTNQTGDVTLSTNTGRVLVIDNTKTNGNYNYHWDDASYYTDAPTTDGYYLLGNEAFVTATSASGTAWKFSTGIKMNSLSGDGDKANYVLSVNATVEFKVRSYFNITPTWLSFGKVYNGEDGITTKGSTVNDNVELEAGTYSIFINSSDQVWVIRGTPLNAFCVEFLNEIDLVCDDNGGTDLDELKSTWSTLSSLYSTVFTDDKTTIVAIGFNGGSDVDDAHKVVKAYNYIVTKYGTSNCSDFIWGQTITGANQQRVLISSVIADRTNTIAIIVVISVVSVGAIGGYFFIRKRKENN